MKMFTQFNMLMKGLQYIVALCLFSGGLMAQPVIITDNTPSTAINDGIVGVGEYVGSSTGINSGFGNVFGSLSTLYIDSDVNGDINIGLVSGGASLSNQGVIYIDCVAGGFANTTAFTDNGDAGRSICSAIGASTPTGRADIYFPTGFTADYAISIENGFSSIFQLVGGGSHVWLGSANITPSGNAGAGQWEINFNLNVFGLNPGATLNYIVSYGDVYSGSGLYRSDEFHGVAASTVTGGNIGVASVTLAAGDYNVFHSIPAFLWNGSADNNWNNPLNWDNHLVPSAMYDATIPAVAKAAAPFPNIFGSASVLSLTMMPGSSLIIWPPGELTVNGTFINNGSLTLKADANGTASLIETNGVNAIVERFLFPDRWNSVSSPISGATAATFLGIYLQYYDETTLSWLNVVLPTDPISTGIGYNTWSSGSTYTGSYVGNLNTGIVNLPVTYTGDHWNLVGNPYPSAIDWGGAGWVKTDIDAAVYVWEGTQYLSNVPATGIGTLTGGIIPAQQSFFVHVAATPAGTPSLKVSDASRVHGVDPYKNTVSTDAFRLSVSGNNYTDVTFVALNSGSTYAFDGSFDAYKLMGIEAAPQLYTRSQEDQLSINTIPGIVKGLSIPLSLSVGATGIYEITLENLQGFENFPIYLRDLKENKIVDLKNNPLYKCEASPDDDANRFLLYFSHDDVPLSGEMTDNSGVLIVPMDKTILISSEKAVSGLVVVYNLLGQKILSQSIHEESTIEIPMDSKSGNYIVRLQSKDGIMSKKVFVK